MSKSGLIIEERSRDIGDFLVGRLIPFRKKRMIGPFVFIDHIGPTTVGPNKYIDVGQHPHIGLATLTYMLAGEIMHEDSLGTRQLIQPGAVNWMVAGRGITHTERTPIAHRDGGSYKVHGYQIWVALPKAMEDMEPSSCHIPKKDLPTWVDDSAHFTLVAGSGFGKTSPVPVHSELFMVAINTKEAYQLNIQGALKGEIGICIVKGQINACSQTIQKGNILVSKVADSCTVSLAPQTQLLLFGGIPLKEERHMYWNFVSSSKEKIVAAKASWVNKTFPMLADDSSYIPLAKP